MTTQIEFGFPLKDQRIYQFANFQVGKKHKDSMINDIQVYFLSNKKAKVIVIATDKNELQFKKEFLCHILIQQSIATCSYIVTFTRVQSDNQYWYSLSSQLVSSILAS
jgi:hypothetical protein